MQLRSSVIHALGALCVAAGAGRASLAQQTRPDAPVAILRLSIPSAAVGSDLYYGFFAHVEEGLYREFAHDPDVQVFPAAAGGGRTSDSPAGDDPIAIDATVTTNGRSTQSSANIYWVVSSRALQRSVRGSVPSTGPGAGEATFVVQKIAFAVRSMVDSVLARR